MKIPVSEAVGVRVIKSKPRRNTPMLVFGLPLVAAALMIGSLIFSPGKAQGTGRLPKPQEVTYAGQVQIPTATHSANSSDPTASNPAGSASNSSNGEATHSTRSASSSGNNTPATAPSASGGSSSSTGDTSSTAASSTSTGSSSSISTPSLNVSVGGKPLVSTSSLSLGLN